jgi:hypothetical protein
MPPNMTTTQRRSPRPRRAPQPQPQQAAVLPADHSWMGVTIIYDAPRTPGWDALWRWLLIPLPEESEVA